MKTPILTLTSGDQIPALGLGTWKSDPGQVAAAVLESLKLGYRHIDCASIYGNEAEIGSALAEAIDSGLVRREDLWITSKLWNSSHRKDDVLPALKQMLSDLRLDYLDLYLMHWPVALKPGVGFPTTAEEFLSEEEAPIDEVWAAMEDAVDAGLCRNIGVSNFNAHKLKTLFKGARIAPAMNQVEGHPLLAQNKLLEFCQEAGVLLTAYAPLGSPDRPELVRQATDPVLLENPVINEIAAAQGVSAAQVLLAWAVNRGTCVIPKSVTPSRLKENLAAGAIALNDEEMARIAALDQGYRLIAGGLWAMEGSPYSLEWLWQK